MAATRSDSRSRDEPSPDPRSSGGEVAEAPRPHSRLAVALTGGGARGAYQVGVLRGLGRAFPELRFPIITGVSAGAVNATFLACRDQGLGPVSEQLARIWSKIEVEHVVRSNLPWLAWNFARWVLRLGFGTGLRAKAMLDTAPLDQLLRGIFSEPGAKPGTPIRGIRSNLDAGRLEAMALSTVNYGTGQTVHWVMGNRVEPWSAPLRRARLTELTVRHVMASAALPLIFPAVRLDDGWYGDGGIRLAAPLSPALHLGADRILAVSTRYDRSQREADRSVIRGYPPPAQIVGNLMNAIFLDVLDQDAQRLERLNGVVERLEPEQRGGLKPVRLVLMRPSQDLGRLAGDLDPGLPKSLRFLVRNLGSEKTRSPDFLSLLLFQPDYVGRLIEIGERDVQTRLDEIRSLIFDSEEV